MTKRDAMLFKQFFLRHFELIDFRLIAARYAVSAISAFEVILLPFILHPALYAEIEMNRQILSFLPIALLGASLGYVRIYFKAGSEKIDSDLISGTIISASITAILVFMFSKSLLFSFSSFIFIFCTSSERIIFAEGKLILATLYKLFISISVIIIFWFLNKYYNEKISIYTYFLCINIGCFIWLFIIRSKIFNSIQNIEYGSIRNYIKLIYGGFLLNSLTYFILLYFIIDRYFISIFFKDKIYEYAVSFSISQIPIVLMNTIAYSFLYKMGNNINKMNLNDYKMYRKSSILVFIITFVLGSFFGFLYFDLISMPDKSIFIFLILNFFLGLYFALSATTGVSLYLNLSRQALLIFIISMLINIIISPFFITVAWSPELYVFKSGTILVVSAILLDRLIIKRLRQH